MSNETQDLFDIYEAFATDPELELRGKWFPVGKKGHIKVARTGNENFNSEFRKLVEEKQLDLNDGGPGADQIAQDIMLQCQAKAILVDWKGLSYQGKEVTYTVEMAKTLLAVKDFRKRVLVLADSFENYRVKQEEQQKNA